MKQVGQSLWHRRSVAGFLCKKWMFLQDFMSFWNEAGLSHAMSEWAWTNERIQTWGFAMASLSTSTRSVMCCRRVWTDLEVSNWCLNLGRSSWIRSWIRAWNHSEVCSNEIERDRPWSKQWIDPTVRSRTRRGWSSRMILTLNQCWRGYLR